MRDDNRKSQIVRTHNKNFVFADLFSGAGLFSAGIQEAGFTPIHAVDLDIDAVATYNHNVANVAVEEDVNIIPKNLKADLLIAGPPCQGFSTLGRRDPADQRNNLGLKVIDWAIALDAKVVVIENVPPFLNSTAALEIKNRLDQLGYFLNVFTLNASSFGAAQNRTRAFTIASKYGLLSAPQDSGSVKKTVRNVLLQKKIHPNDAMNIWPTPTELAMQRIKLVRSCGNKRDIMENAPELCPKSWFIMGNQATDVWGRMDPDQPSNTIRCAFQNPSKGRYIHPTENRVISLREGARLQGISDKWQFTGSRTSIARQIGNGVPVPLARAIGTALMKHMIENISLPKESNIAA